MFPSTANVHRKTCRIQAKIDFKAIFYYNYGFISRIFHCKQKFFCIKFSFEKKKISFWIPNEMFQGESAMRPFLVQIFKAYESPIQPDKATAVISIVIILANIVFMCLVRFTGKRKLYLAMAAGVFITSFVITLYGFIYLPRGCISFDQKIQSAHLENNNLAYIPMICLFLWSFFTFCGLMTMPWMLISEWVVSRELTISIFFFSFLFSFTISPRYLSFRLGYSLSSKCLIIFFFFKFLEYTENIIIYFDLFCY